MGSTSEAERLSGDSSRSLWRLKTVVPRRRLFKKRLKARIWIAISSERWRAVARGQSRAWRTKRTYSNNEDTLFLDAHLFKGSVPTENLIIFRSLMTVCKADKNIFSGSKLLNYSVRILDFGSEGSILREKRQSKPRHYQLFGKRS